MKVCLAQPMPSQASETFLRAHAEKLPGNVTVVHGKRARLPTGRISLREHCRRAPLAVARVLSGRPKRWEYTQSYLRMFRKLRPDVVVAEYGIWGVHVMDACRQLDIPLIAHFRGADASKQEFLDEYLERYKRLVQRAEALVAVSQPIKQRLISWGAPPEKIYHNPSGADCDAFCGAQPSKAEPVLLAVGRFAETKAPYLTLLAFWEVARDCPNARLRMIGGGPLMPFCRQLVQQMRLEHAVTLLGVQSHEVVRAEMKAARGFVQHSVTAADGDEEGTPCSIMEAGASGLPVVATRNAGIPDVVVDGETGFLIDEHDVHAMAARMKQLIEDPALADRLGAAAQYRVREQFSQVRSLERLSSIIQSVLRGHKQIRHPSARAA